MNISIEIIGLTISTIGEILLAGMVLMVHHKLRKDKKIDKAVLQEMSLEEIIGVFSIILMILGYLFQLNFFEHLSAIGR